MFCNYCGTGNPDDSSFCSSCGKVIKRGPSGDSQRPGPSHEAQEPLPPPIAEPPVQKSPSPRPQRGPVLAIILGSLVVFGSFIVVIAAVGWSFLQPEQTVEYTTPPPEAFQPYTPVTADPAPSPPEPAVDLARVIPQAEPSPVPPPPVVPVAPPPPPAPTDPLVGEWKTELLVGDGYLSFTEDGRIHVRNLLTDEWGIYVFNDGDLEIQKDSVFSHVVVHWRAQVSGDSLRVIEPEGASHIYKRVR